MPCAHQSVAHGQQADFGGDVFIAGYGRFHVDHDVGFRQHGANGGLGVVGDIVGLFEGRGPDNGQGHVGENLRPAAAEANLADFGHAGHLSDGRLDLFLHAFGDAV